VTAVTVAGARENGIAALRWVRLFPSHSHDRRPRAERALSLSLYVILLLLADACRITVAVWPPH